MPLNKYDSYRPYVWDLFSNKGSYFDYESYFQSLFKKVEKDIFNLPKSNMQFFLSTADVNDESATYKFAIPNLEKNTVSVSLKPGKATLKYKVRSLHSDEISEEQTHKLSIPSDIVTDSVSLDYIDGVLILRLSRTKQDSVTVKLSSTD